MCRLSRDSTGGLYVAIIKQREFFADTTIVGYDNTLPLGSYVHDDILTKAPRDTPAAPPRCWLGGRRPQLWGSIRGNLDRVDDACGPGG